MQCEMHVAQKDKSQERGINPMPYSSWHLERDKRSQQPPPHTPVPLSSVPSVHVWQHHVPHQTSLEPQRGPGRASQKQKFQRKKKPRNVSAKRTLEIILFHPHVLLVRKLKSTEEVTVIWVIWGEREDPSPLFREKSELDNTILTPVTVCVFFHTTKQFSDTSWVSYNSVQL